MTETLDTPASQATTHGNRPFADAAPAWAGARDVSDYVIRLASEHDELGAEKESVTGLMARAGITSSGDWRRTPHGTALNVTANGHSAWQLWKTIAQEITTADVWLSPVKQPGIRLLVCDMDSTMIATESLDELAAHVGIGEQVAEITSRAMNGELDFVEALNERVGLLSNLDYAVVEQCVAETRLNPGARELIAHARNAGARTVLVTGGFTPFAEFVGRQLGVDHIVANTLEIRDGMLTGRVLEPIVTRDTKLDVLQQECRALNLSPEECCTIGDGANDIPMLVAAGTGVAYRAKPVVLEATPHHLTHAPLDVLTDWLTWPR